MSGRGGGAAMSGPGGDREPGPLSTARGSWERRLAPLPARDLAGGLRVHDARGLSARGRGLGGLESLPADRALRIPRCRAVHTFTMRFALDLIWLGPDGSVVRVDRAVPPRRHRGCAGARAVVETRAGCADRFLAAGIAGYTSVR
jgi:uncharacterized membrane protein (UPF0127 family)